jgi:hypothetical protein
MLAIIHGFRPVRIDKGANPTSGNSPSLEQRNAHTIGVSARDRFTG